MDAPPPAAPPDGPFGRLVAALLLPAGRAQPALVATQGPLAVLEVADGGAGIVVLDEAGASAEDLRRRVDAILHAHQAGVLYLVVTGGGAEARSVLLAADREAPDLKRLGLYHLRAAVPLDHVAGRRLRVLESAAARLAAVSPLSAADATAAIARARREREETAHFAAAVGGRLPRATLVFVVACVVLHLVAAHFGRHGWEETKLRMGANSAPLVRAGEIWRLLASAFLHDNLVHLLVNMLALQSFGGFLETVIGWRRYVVLYCASALGGSLASALVGGSFLSVGASGALWGLMAAGFGLVRGRQALIPSHIAARLRQRLVVVLVLNGLLSLLPRIDLWAHAGGAIVGLAFAGARLLGPRPPAAADVPSPSEPRWVALAAAISVLAMAASLAAAIFFGRPWR